MSKRAADKKTGGRAKRNKAEPEEEDTKNSGFTDEKALANEIIEDVELLSALNFERISKTLTDINSIEQHIVNVADLLLNKSVLFINKQPWRFSEIEFYLQSDTHTDFFTHCDPMQKTFAKWYLHKTGTAYRSGTYKGIDLTFGSADAFGGILIRAIESLTDPSKFVEGPCVCADTILSLNSMSQPQELAALLEKTDLSALKSPNLYVGTAEKAANNSSMKNALTKKSVFDLEPRRVYRSARVGLTLKKSSGGHARNPSADVTKEQSEWIFKPYRFFTNPAKMKKGKHYPVLQLHFIEKMTADEIAKTCKMTKPAVTKLIDLAKAGQQKSLATFVGQKLSNDDVCSLFGVLNK